jgi:hypothetical protein
MKPAVRRTLPWLVTSCLALACDGERRKPPASPTDAVSKTGDAKANANAKPDAKANAVADAEPDAKANAVAEPDAKADPDPTPTAPVLTPPPEPVPPRAVVFYREAPKARIALFALPEPTAPDPTAARDLKIIADDEGGSIYHGTSGPVLSGDGQWLAYLDAGRLQLVRLDGSAKHRITKHKGSKVEVLISGFSPDSSRLMFYQGEVQSEEGTPLPRDVVQGLHELLLADLTIAPKTSLQAFTTYTADGRHVLFQRQQPDRSNVLIRFDLDTGAEEEVARIDSPFGFSQLVLHGERIAYTYSPAQGRSRIATHTLRGDARKDVSPEGKFAQLQWPRISLDGTHVTYTDETALIIHTLADDTSRTLFTCTQRHCEHAFDGASTVLVRDGEQLSRVALDGGVTTLAEGVKGFVVAGAPG